MNEGRFKTKKINKAIGWLVRDCVDSGEMYTEQLFELCEQQVYNVLYHQGKDLPELGWYQVETILDMCWEEK